MNDSIDSIDMYMIMFQYKSYIMRVFVIISMMRDKVDKSCAVPAGRVFFVLDWR